MAKAEEEEKSGVAGLLLPLALVLLLGFGTGYLGFKALGIAPAKDEAPAAADAAAAQEGQAAKQAEGRSAQGAEEKKGASKDDKSLNATQAALLAAQQKARRIDLAKTVIVPMQPILANLANPSTTWIRLEGSLAIVPKAGEKPADVASTVAPYILSYVKTLTLQNVQGATGLEFMNMDFNEIARTVSEGRVHAVLITGFIVE